MIIEISAFKTIKEQADEQGIKIQKIEFIDKLREALLLLMFHEIISEAEFQKGCKRLEKLIKKHIV